MKEHVDGWRSVKIRPETMAKSIRAPQFYVFEADLCGRGWVDWAG